MKTRQTLYLILALIFTSGCGGGLNMQPQINEVNSIQHSRTLANNGLSGWVVGQWTLYRTSQVSTEDIFQLFDGRPEDGFRKIAITGKSADAFWLEQHIVWPESEQYIAALVSNQAAAGNPVFQIHRLKFTDDRGNPIELDASQLDDKAAQQPLDETNYLLNLIIMQHQPGRARNITVPGGTFLDTHVVPFSMSLQFGQVAGNALFSQIVPVASMIKLQSNQITSRWFNQTTTWELVDFAQTGASSHFILSHTE